MRLAGAELDAAVGDEIERGDALGDARRVIVVRRHQARCRGRGGCAWCAAQQAARNTSGAERVRVLLEEVVLDFPGVVDAELVGELDLIERLLELACCSSPTFHGRGSWCS
mgnify:CR=1 FL=1